MKRYNRNNQRLKIKDHYKVKYNKTFVYTGNTLKWSHQIYERVEIQYNLDNETLIFVKKDLITM